MHIKINSQLAGRKQPRRLSASLTHSQSEQTAVSG